MRRKQRRNITVALAALGAAAALAGAAWTASTKPYAVAIHPEYETTPLLSVGNQVPEASDPSKTYQMVGIPDGLGAHPRPNGRITLFMNHELGNTALSEPVIGEPLNRGAIVSKLTLDEDGKVLRAERAYDQVFLAETLVGDAATVNNSTPGFARFCSGSLAGEKEGFQRWIYFANEESAGPGTFDGKGGLSVAIIDNKAYALPDLGRFAWEQTMAQPSPKGNKVVLIGMEDGPANMDFASGNSAVYMYVGTKSDAPGASVLARNGLVGGKLYVLAPVNPAKGSEAEFKAGTLPIKWVEIPDAGAKTDVELEAASDTAGAFRFARPEDADWNNKNRNQLIFVTTGESRVADVLSNDNSSVVSTSSTSTRTM
jgi:secreted PhoX family phosphatase